VHQAAAGIQTLVSATIWPAVCMTSTGFALDYMPILLLRNGQKHSTSGTATNLA
jgi:hypothetical protein